MKSEFTLAFNEIVEHSKLKREVIIEALENALVSAYRREVNASTAQHVVAKVDMTTESFRIYAEKEVVEDVVDVRTEVTLDDARQVDPEIKLGDMITVESTPPKNFGRIAAQTAKQVILQRLRESERESQYQEYANREGDIIHGTVQSVTSQSVTIGLGRTEAVMPRNQQVPGERYRAHDKLRAFVLEVRKTPRGPQIIVSRTHKNMLRRLLENEVPEIYNGLVEIKSIAREPGHRSKVAVAALQEGVDPVGACVGMRGVRIQSIVKELNDEKIDVIEWNSDPAAFIAKSLSPARVSGVYLDDDPINGRTATVVVPDDQLSLAIGREGQNARLAAKLTNWRIDIKSVIEAGGETIKHLRANTALAEKLMAQLDQAELTLAKKAESKPIMPEEYTNLSKLVEAYEKFQAQGRQALRAEKAQKVAAIRAAINPEAYNVKLQDSGLPDRVIKLLREGDYDTVGQVLEAMTIDEDRILKLEGFGPKVMEELKTGLAAIQLPESEPAVEAVSAEQPAEPAVAVAPAAEAEAVAAEPAVAAPKAEGEIEVEQTIEELIGDEEEDEGASGVDKKKKKGKKKGKATREVTYNEELGVYIATKKRKSSRSTDWGDSGT
ncbi:MAG: transcription termination factor NusA [Chloroflexota bacterium]